MKKVLSTKSYGELGISLGMAILALIFIVLADFKQNANPMDPGPALFPRLTGGFTIVFCAIQIVSSLGKKMYVNAKEKLKEEKQSRRLKFLYVFGTLGVSLIYIYLFELVNYMFLTGIFLLVVMALLGIRKWKVLVGVSVIYAIASYVLYAQVFGVPL